MLRTWTKRENKIRLKKRILSSFSERTKLRHHPHFNPDKSFSLPLYKKFTFAVFCSLKFPVAIQVESCKQVIEPMKLQSGHAHRLLDDLNTCKSVVKYESSPVKELLCDLQNFTRKRSFDFAVKIGDAQQEPVTLTVNKDEMCSLDDISLRKRSKSNSIIKFELPFVDPPVVVSEPKPSPVPVLALEWVEQQQEDESQTNDHESQQHDEDSNWLQQPPISMICDLCEMTSKIGHRVPKVAVFLWAQFMQLLSRGRKFLCRKQDDNNALNNHEITRESTRECYIASSSKDFIENKNRAVAEKKTKRHDTKKTLKRAHAAMVQMHSHNTNRKRAMNCAKFRRENGRRCCWIQRKQCQDTMFLELQAGRHKVPIALATPTTLQIARALHYILKLPLRLIHQKKPSGHTADRPSSRQHLSEAYDDLSEFLSLSEIKYLIITLHLWDVIFM